MNLLRHITVVRATLHYWPTLYFSLFWRYVWLCLISVSQFLILWYFPLIAWDTGCNKFSKWALQGTVVFGKLDDRIGGIAFMGRLQDSRGWVLLFGECYTATLLHYKEGVTASNHIQPMVLNDAKVDLLKVLKDKALSARIRYPATSSKKSCWLFFGCMQPWCEPPCNRCFASARSTGAVGLLIFRSQAVAICTVSRDTRHKYMFHHFCLGLWHSTCSLLEQEPRRKPFCRVRSSPKFTIS